MLNSSAGRFGASSFLAWRVASAASGHWVILPVSSLQSGSQSVLVWGLISNSKILHVPPSPYWWLYFQCPVVLSTKTLIITVAEAQRSAYHQPSFTDTGAMAQGSWGILPRVTQLLSVGVWIITKQLDSKVWWWKAPLSSLVSFYVFVFYSSPQHLY